ncbi:unnamed protein product [Paramecium sonneborni]|uniref:Uncharacterized protein n=1 Tax=Paramecium sonneborni TaxID=65129 RepID=A0A8S1NTR7_9CILI|nr:unnamed protein product [Paramecium sonneborni]
MIKQFFYFKCFKVLVEALYIQHFVTSQISNNEGWKIQNPYNGATVLLTNCAGNIIFGGYQVFGCFSTARTELMKYFILPPHYNLRIDIRHWKIDDWLATQNFNIIADQQSQSWRYTANTGPNLCGGSGADQNSPIHLSNRQHTLNSVIARFFSDCNNNNFWGITDFELTVLECYSGCQFCLDSTVDCTMWILWKSHFDLQNLNNGFEGWIKNSFPVFQYITNNYFQIKMLGINQGESAINNFILPDHRSFIIQFRVEYLSNLPQTFRIYLNDEQQLEFISNSRKYVDYRSDIINDSRNQIKLEIRSINGRIAIRELSIILRGPINLISCIDNNLEPFDGCFAKQESCQQGCIFCVKGECLMCDTQWIYNELNNNCEPLCGDKYIIANEQCDDGNDFPFDGCHQCQFSCPLNCQNCIFGQCQVCITGYYYFNGICNQIYQNFFEETVLIQNNNLKGNQISSTYYGDINLKQIAIYYYERSILINEFEMFQFQCKPFCEVCVYGKCMKCLDNYLLLKNQCISRITKGIFLFEDGIHTSTNEIGCYKCHESCQIQCLQCLNSYCILCKDGWQLFNGYCVQICGDNQVAIISQEQCDSNLDDCLNCNIVCPQNCQYCQNTKECLVCNESYIVIEHECQLTCNKECKICDKSTCLDDYSNQDINIDEIQNSICGDGIEQQQELCDDGNNIQFDGCFNCQYSCPLNCLNCLDGICFKCEQQFQLIDHQCYEQYCGNGIKYQDEQCDDGNIIDADGCSSNCQIEVHYKCHENYYGQSECQYYKSPYMMLKLLNQTFNKYYIQISFSQEIYFNDNYVLESLFNINIDNIKNEDYAIKLESNYQPTINQILNYQFILEITLFISTNTTQSNILLVNEALNQNDMKLINPFQKIILKEYIQMTQADFDKTRKLTQYQQVMITTQGIMSVISIISGNFQMLVEILDNLQYISYLKYININYPENLYLFFESTNIISINPILEYFTIRENFEIYLYQDYIQSQYKLKYYSLNAHLITNLQFFFIQVFTVFVLAILLKTICYIFLKLCDKKRTQKFISFKFESLTQKILFKIQSFIYNIFHQIFIFACQFNLNGVQNILLANAWDLLFKTFLYLTSQSGNDKVSIIQAILSYLLLASLGYTLIILLKHSFLKKKQRLNNRYKVLYLIKQFFFCYYLICFQKDQFIQLVMLITTNLIYLIVLIKVEFNLQTLEKIQIIIQEISIIAFTFTSMFYLLDYNYLIDAQNQITLGFSQIYFLISGLLWIFIKYIILIYQRIKQNCLQRMKKQKLKNLRKATHLIFEVVS